MELQENYGEFEALGAEVLAISVDDGLDAARIVEAYSLEFPVLYDTTEDVTRAWGIFDLLDDGVAAPAAYVFDTSGRLFAYGVGENIADRPTAAELLATLAAA